MNIYNYTDISNLNFKHIIFIQYISEDHIHLVSKNRYQNRYTVLYHPSLSDFSSTSNHSYKTFDSIVSSIHFDSKISQTSDPNNRAINHPTTYNLKRSLPNNKTASHNADGMGLNFFKRISRSCSARRYPSICYSQCLHEIVNVTRVYARSRKKHIHYFLFRRSTGMG